MNLDWCTGEREVTGLASCASLLRAEVHLRADGYAPLEAALHRVLLVDPLVARALALLSAVRGRAEPAEVMQHAHAEHAVLGAVRVLGAPAAGVVLEVEHDVARRRAAAAEARLREVRARVGDGGDERLERGREPRRVERVEAAGRDVHAAVEQVVWWAGGQAGAYLSARAGHARA